MGLFDNFLNQVGQGDSIKDYRHASRLFVDNNYARSPKYSWLFHVFFDLNPTVTNINNIQQMESGMLVKAADLPKFRVDTKTYNNYNRPTIAQSKARYEDITITFHDDQSNIVRLLWFDYFNYYYRDMDNSYGDSTGSLNPIFQAPNKQVLGQRNLFNNFGYTLRKDLGTNQYINAIRIYSLHQKRFSEYTLINPVITSFRHGGHNTGSDQPLECTMTISYETVLYASGAAKVARGGFADLHYDKSPSPLTPAGGGTNSILGPGGILSTIDEVVTDASGQTAGGYGAAAFKLFRGYQNKKNVDLRGLAKAELTTAFEDIISGKDPRDRFFTPTIGAGVNNQNANFIPYTADTVAGTNSVTSNGSGINLSGALVTGGLATALSGNPEIGAGVAIAGLLTNPATQEVIGGAVNKVVNLIKSKDPTTGENVLVAESAEPIPTFSFAAAIQSANERAASLANAAKAQAESALGGNGLDSLPSLVNSAASLQQSLPVFNTGTNNLISSASNILAQTPWGGQIPAVPDTANKLASDAITSQPALSYAGARATNPAPGTG